MKRKVLYPFLIVLPILFILLSLFAGRYTIPTDQVLNILWSKITMQDSSLPSNVSVIVWDIRLPRALAAALVGAALAVSGASFQGLFSNPLVNSGILGVSSGAGFGAALAIIIFGQTPFTVIFAFVFGCMAVGLSYMSARIYKSTPTIMLVLGGVVVSAIFSALISFIKYVADPYNQLPAIVFWLMGSLASVNKETLVFSAIPMLIGIIGLYIMRWRLNILSMGDREAQALGINVPLNKGLIIAFATLATAGAVCVAGIVGWIGLIIPHIGRMTLGSDNKSLIPVSIALGAAFLLLIDTLARSLTGSEIPLGYLLLLLADRFSYTC